MMMLLRVIAVAVLCAGLTLAQDPPLAAFRNFGGSQCTDTGLAFDGSDDFLAISPDFDLADSHTISMRLKYIDMTRNYERLYDFSGSNCGEQSYFVDADEVGRMTHQTYGCGSIGVDNFWIYGDGQFHTYSFTSSSSGEFKAYRDGSLMGRIQGGCSAARHNDARNTHYIGGSTCVPQGILTFHGEMEWFAIHDAVLSSDQLQQVSSTAVRSQASHFFDFVTDCDSSANGVPSVPVPSTTTTQTSTSTTTTQTSTTQTSTTTTQTSTTQTSTTHTADQQRDVRLNRLEAQLSAVGAQVSTMAAAAGVASPALVGTGPAQGPPQISADGNTISVTAQACGGTVDICAAMQRVDRLADAVAGN